MNRHISLVRRMALLLVAHARRLMLRKHAFWADGMLQEVHHIADDWAAFYWAMGCVFASYRKSVSPTVLAVQTIKIFLVVLIGCFSYENFIGPLQAIGCYIHVSKSAMDVLASLPDDRIVCISWPAVPVSIQAMSIAAGALYVFSGIQLVRSRSIALPLFVLAFAAGWIAFIFEQGVPALTLYRYSLLLEGVLEHVAISRAIIPLLVALGIWLTFLSDTKERNCRIS